MAKMKRPVGDLVSGKLGNVVFVNYKGKSYVRSAPDRSNAKWSDLQKLYRIRLSKIALIWRSIKSDLIVKIWNSFSTSMNGYASFVKANMPALEIDGELINPIFLTVSQGSLKPLEWLSVEKINPTQVQVQWKNDPNLPALRLRDQLIAISYNNGAFSEPINTNLIRSAEEGIFNLPLIPNQQEINYLFLFLQSENKKFYSKSLSFYLPDL